MKNDDLDHVKKILRQAYQHFNKRDIDSALAAMHSDVDWPNGMEGGIEHGHEAVRTYWTRQWTMINLNVEPIGLKKEADGRINVTAN